MHITQFFRVSTNRTDNASDEDNFSSIISSRRLSIMASELKVDKFTGVTTAGSILVTGEGNSTTTNLQQGLAKAWVQYDMGDNAYR